MIKSVKAAPRALNDAPLPIRRDVVLNLGKNMVYKIGLIYFEPQLEAGRAYNVYISVKNANGKTYSANVLLESEDL